MKIKVEHEIDDDKKLQDKIVCLGADLICREIVKNLEKTVMDVIEIKTIEHLHDKLQNIYETSTIRLRSRNVPIDEYISIQMQEHLQAGGLGLEKINEKVDEMVRVLKESYDLMFAQRIINAYRKQEGKERIEMEEVAKIIGDN